MSQDYKDRKNDDGTSSYDNGFSAGYEEGLICDRVFMLNKISEKVNSRINIIEEKFNEIYTDERINFVINDIISNKIRLKLSKDIQNIFEATSSSLEDRIKNILIEPDFVRSIIEKIIEKPNSEDFL